MKTNSVRTISVWIVAIAAFVSLVLSPFFLGRYATLFLNNFMVFLVLSLSFNIIYGYAGFLNLGHVVFYGVGGYVFGISYNLGAGAILSLGLSLLAGLTLAVFLALPLFRLRSGYFAIATLALAILFHRLAYNLDWLTGGFQGLIIRSGDVALASYFLLLPLVVAALATNYLLDRSGLGLTLRAIRSDEEVVSTLGINTLKPKILSFLISASFPSVCGAVSIFYNGYFTPESAFGTTTMFLPPIMTLIGGAGNPIGPVAGALIMSFTSEYLAINLPSFSNVVLGLLLILVGTIFPGGILSAIKLAKFEWRNRR